MCTVCGIAVVREKFVQMELKTRVMQWVKITTIIIIIIIIIINLTASGVLPGGSGYYAYT
jgi:hypothetical protein